MGVVYKAQHIHMEREMAIKTLATEMSPESEPFRRFKQEAKVIAALNHPNIVDIHDFAIQGNQAYLVMDFLDGIHIEKAIDEFGPMGLDHFIHIFSQACEALAHAHNKGIIHRDLKGGNMMIVTEDDRRDILKVVDFGISKLLSDDDVEEDLILTRTSKIVGSPLFMSPEQCLGHDFDHRVDIYSLGIVMYRSLTGEMPLVGENAMKTLHKQITEPPPPFFESNPDVFVPQALELVVRKALAKRADERQQTMLELLHDLKEAVRVPDLSTAGAQEMDSVPIPAVEPVAAAPADGVGSRPEPAQSNKAEPTSTEFVQPGSDPTSSDLATSSRDADDDWKNLTAGAGLTSVAPPTPDRAQLEQIPRPQPPLPLPLPANPSLPAGVSSNAFAARWRATSQPMQNQRSSSQPASGGQRVPLPGSGSYQAYIAGTRSAEAPKPRSRVNPALFKFGQFEAPPEGLPAIPPSQSFKQSLHGSSSSISHGTYQGTSNQAKDPGPGSMKEQLDQIIRRSASQAKIDKIIEEQDQLAASKRNMPAYQPASSSFRPASSGGGKKEDVPESTGDGAGKGRPPRYKSAPVVDEFFLDKLLDKVTHPFRKLFEKKEETYVQQVSAPSEATASPMTLILFVVAPIVVVGFLAWQFWPRSMTVDQAYGRVPHVYKSADGQVSFQLTSRTSCKLQVDDRRNSTNCRFYLNDWRDAVELSLGYPFQNQYWLYETRDGIADDAGNSFYGAYSPESEVVEKIDSIAKYAAACYKKTGRYPDSASVPDVDGVNLKYKNPFTKDPEVPSFQSITIGSGKDEASDKKERKKFFINMRKGRSWEDAPEEHPGQIRCCAVTFKSGKGDSQAFVAQIIARNGKPMRGFNSDTAYFYALENGKPYEGFAESDAPKFPFTQNRGQPDVVWFFLDKPDRDLVSVFKNGAIIAFGVVAVFVVLLVLSSKSLMRNLMRP